MKRIFIILLCFLMLIPILSACRDNKQNTSKKTVAVSITPQATFAQKVVGDKFDIITVIPAGASPETYEPTPAKVREIADAEIYFSIGVPTEENSITPIISDKTQVVALHKKVNEVYPDLMDDGGRDPHIWLSPKRVIVMIEEIADTFIKADSQNAEFYQANADSYIAELKRLDSYIKTAFESKANRKFIAFHPAFSYFAEDYSLSQYALEEHGKETTAKRLAEIADLAKKENIKTIFYQAEASQNQVLAFAEEIDGEAVMLEPLAADYTQNLKVMTDLLEKAME